MPKAKPLPADPVERAKIERKREQTRRAVAAWGRRNRPLRRLMVRAATRTWRAKRAMREAYALLTN
jgi:hypothetical protein